jgi:ABC-2 type transport system ATP-binding protein
MTTNAVLAERLRRRFDDLMAVDGIDLSIPAGEIYGFLGPNGAGKSTTVRMLTTLLAPTDGTAFVAGHDVRRDPEAVRLRIGVALQDAALDPKQSGRELLDLQARLYGLRRDDRLRRVDEVISIVDIGDAIDRRIATYSGGMRRRLDLAAALIHQPQVLFLDEPTTGLDPASRQTVWDEVSRLNRDLGMTIFLTTQYLEEADALCHRVGIINAGVIVAEGTPADLKRRIGTDLILVRVEGAPEPAVDALRVLPGIDRVDTRGDLLLVATGSGSASISPVAVALDAAGVAVRELTLRTPTLDDVFLELTGGHLQGGDE